MSPFESIIMTDGEQEMERPKTEGAEVSLEKRKGKIEELLLLKAKQRVEDFWKNFEKSVSSIEARINTVKSQELIPMDVYDILKKIDLTIQLYESENKLNNTINGIPEYFEFRKELKDAEDKLQTFADKETIIALGKSELVRQFKNFREGDTMKKLKALANSMAPKD